MTGSKTMSLVVVNVSITDAAVPLSSFYIGACIMATVGLKRSAITKQRVTLQQEVCAQL